jgi:hypothetical protein
VEICKESVEALAFSFMVNLIYPQEHFKQLVLWCDYAARGLIETMHQTQTPHGMNIIALVVLQNLADSEKVQGLCSEICPASSCDVYQAISIKAEVFSDAEEEVYHIPITFTGIKVEPEVSCLSVG